MSTSTVLAFIPTTADPSSIEIGRGIKRARNRKAILQITLAQDVGIPLSYLSQIESGTLVPSDELVKAIARELECTVTSLTKS